MPNKQTSKSKRARKPKKRVHHGELDVPEGAGVVQGARNIFLCQVAKLVRGVLADLWSGPFCDFRELDQRERQTVGIYAFLRGLVSDRFERGLHMRSWRFAQDLAPWMEKEYLLLPPTKPRLDGQLPEVVPRSHDDPRKAEGGMLQAPPLTGVWRLLAPPWPGPYESLWQGTRLAEGDVPSYHYGTARSEPGDIVGHTLSLFAGLWQWQETHHLKVAWVLTCALETMQSWTCCARQNSDERGWKLNDPIDTIPGPGPGPSPRSTLFPDMRDYEPAITTRSDYLEQKRCELREAINGNKDLRKVNTSVISNLNNLIDAMIEAIEQQCRELEKWYREIGFNSTPDKPEIEKHMRWAVEFQVLGRTFSEIAAEEEEEIYEVSTVSRAAKGALRLIGLSPRPEGLKRGRARGTKISSSATARLAIIRTLGR